MVECERSDSCLAYSELAAIMLRVVAVASASAADALDHGNLESPIPYDTARRFADELLRHADRILDRATANKDAESKATEKALCPQYLNPFNTRPW
jgi:hypothetical protein